ncbi:glutathione S-transferase GstB [Variibacter gotjawalensis]|uniref:glutathione transferase n=1 Tax=Variibacter gotjawalensis TaxID=1333996 RepID=A0A0S3PXN5_9BRAD|nr:glutathione S-transferase [Variibacter gotjawalensis]NIK46507.1 glutathione S-transferase [Variibacter gotjawalensis]RZS48415.1 glutathione S-transferase [Variibacter gotjawalensis]BAT60674.1 glutathione S-transferase GstB [Variibacter gotjawalensis]
MITVHHLNNSRSQRILWLLEELSVPYEIKFYQRDPKTMLAPKELRAVHPLGKSPVITDDGGPAIAESGAIVEYIVERFGQGRLIPPAGTPERERYRMWMHYAEGSAMPPLLMKLVLSRIPRAAPALIRPLLNATMARAISGFIEPQLKNHANYWEGELGKSEWFAGNDFTAADIQMSFPLEAAAARGTGGARPKIDAFLKRIHARPAYQTAIEKGGPYELMR